MNAETASLLAGALGLSVVHAALPPHWLPFTLVGRSFGWSRARTLGVCALAGGAHVAATGALCLAAAWVGKEVIAGLEPYAGPLSGGVLVAIGLTYVVLHFLGWGHAHLHVHTPEHAIAHVSDSGETEPAGVHDLAQGLAARARGVSEAAAILSLFVAMTVSPCEALIAVFLSAYALPWESVVLLAVAVALATLGSMLLFTALSVAGLERVRWHWLEAREKLATGVVLALTGLIVALLGEA